MKYAIISDIHSNLEALNCVLDDISKHSVASIICLGDVLGYGANPQECLKLILDHCDLIIMGNHDQAIEDLALRTQFNAYAQIE